MKYLTTALLFLATSSLANMQSIDGFSIDRTEVTVGQLRKFIEATGYVTTAEKTWWWACIRHGMGAETRLGLVSSLWHSRKAQ
jgi:formylglycine-generating enzyme required for sulfatase activity